MLYQQLLK